jgi:restriction system protein
MHGRSIYERRVYHQELKAYRIIRGATQEDVEAKATYQLEIWANRWKRLQASEENQRIRQQAAAVQQISKIAREQKIRLALQQTQELQEQLDTVASLLDQAISRDYRRDWDALKSHARFPDLAPVQPKPEMAVLQYPPSPPSPEAYRYKPTLIDRLLPFIRSRREAAGKRRLRHAKDEHQREVARTMQLNRAEQERVRQANETTERHYKQLLTAWLIKKSTYEKGQEQDNREVDEKRRRYLHREVDGLVDFWYELLSESDFPDSWPEGCTLTYVQETKTLVVDSELPHINVLPRAREVRYVATRNEFKEAEISDSQRKKLYDETLYRIALATLYKLFQSDEVDALTSVVFNGWVQSIDRATGVDIHPCIMSLQVKKDEFLALNLAHVDPRLCFKKLKGVSESKLVELNPVQPVLSLNKQDPRFVDAYKIAESLDDGTNLAAMDWLDFENLIRELFEKEFSQNGGEVKITQASRDGGVDAVAFDPDPIRGGKIVIQAKRYTNVVGVSAVRDLYGTVHNEGATKGILVTTSNFGADAYEFAKGKPLTLLSGGELLYLLQRHGYRATIDLAEAKKFWLANNHFSPSSPKRVN